MAENNADTINIHKCNHLPAVFCLQMSAQISLVNLAHCLQTEK